MGRPLGSKNKKVLNEVLARKEAGVQVAAVAPMDAIPPQEKAEEKPVKKEKKKPMANKYQRETNIETILAYWLKNQSFTGHTLADIKKAGIQLKDNSDEILEDILNRERLIDVTIQNRVKMSYTTDQVKEVLARIK